MRCRKKGCIGIATRGDAKPAPTCETFQEAEAGCPQHAPGQMRILRCLFPFHLRCSGAIGWSLLAGVTLALRGHGIDQGADAEPHCSYVHRHCRRNPTGGTGTCHCHAREGVGVEIPLTPMEPPGSPIWGFPPSLFPALGRRLSSALGRAGLD